MKTLCVTLLYLFAQSAFTQDYHPFVERGVYRDEFWAAELHLCSYDYGLRYWFRGDTMVGGQTYQLLLATSIQGDPDAPLFCPPYTVDTTNGTLYALLRENVVEKQVFKFDTATNTEFLLFNFSVNVGDSVTVGHPPQTVYIEDEWYDTWTVGSSRRTLVVNTPAGLTNWIESVGASANLWDPLSPVCICPHLICYQQNGQSTPGGECATVVRTKEPAKVLSELLLTPNPASETVTISVPERHLAFDRVTVFDFSGRIAAERHYTTGVFSVVLPVSSWPGGSYLVVLWQGGKWVGRQVFQKN